MKEKGKVYWIVFSCLVLISASFFLPAPFKSFLLADMLLAFSPAASKVSSPATASHLGLGVGFPIRGLVKRVYVKAGDHVAVGDRLADLDTALLAAQLNEAKATLDIQKAALARLQAPLSPADLVVLQDKVSITQAGADDAKKNLFAALLDAYTKGDDAIRSKTDQLFTAPRYNPQFALIADSQMQTDLNARRLYLEGLLMGWRNTLLNIGPGDDLAPYLAPAEINLMQIRNFLSVIAVVLNGAYQDPTNSALTVRNWRFDLSTARTNIETALKNLWAAEGKSQAAQSTLALAQAELDQKKNPPADASVALQQGRVSEAQAKADTLQASINRMSIVAPIAGVISRVNTQVGAMPNSFNSVIYIKNQ